MNLIAATLICLSCTASWYDLKGYRMANGHPFNPNKLTCAHRTLPMGSVLRVWYRGKFVKVTVTDRMPGKGKIDLSRSAFEVLAPLSTGLIPVKIECVRGCK